MASSANARNRERGQRREPKIHHHHRITSNGPLGNGLLGSNLGVHAGQIGEHRLNMSQVHAIDNLFNTHPAVQAARSVLHGQLLSGGLQVLRGGKRATLQPTFQAHLTKYWLPFARDIIDHLLKFGMVPFCFELEPEDLVQKAVKRQTRERSIGDKGRQGRGVQARQAKPPRSQIPVVPMLGTYDIGWAASGRRLHAQLLRLQPGPGMTTKPDEECFVHVRQHPDGVGNINSPIASVFELGSFVTALTDLAYTAEVSRSLPAVTTQVRKPDKINSLDTGALFFDSESRAVAGGQQAEESESAATQLQMQAALAEGDQPAPDAPRGRRPAQPPPGVRARCHLAAGHPAASLCSAEGVRPRASRRPVRSHRCLRATGRPRGSSRAAAARGAWRPAGAHPDECIGLLRVCLTPDRGAAPCSRNGPS